MPIRPSFAGLITQYNRTLFQRNALLKDIPRHPELLDTLEIWDMRLSQFGEKLTQGRLQYVEALEPLAAAAYEGISGGRETLSLSYEKGYEDSLSKALSESRREDMRFGHTGKGPHRGGSCDPPQRRPRQELRLPGAAALRRAGSQAGGSGAF